MLKVITIKDIFYWLRCRIKCLNGTLGFVLFISLICSLLYFFIPENALAYQVHSIQQGQWWRLITGNLMHTNFWHLLMNVLGLWVIAFLYQFHFSFFKFLVLFTLLCLLEGLGLYFFYPIQAYVGLSGVLHGLFAFGAVREILANIKMGYLLLIGVIFKTSYEQIFGSSIQLSQIIEAKVATEAHFVGMFCGIILAISIWALSKRKAQK